MNNLTTNEIKSIKYINLHYIMLKYIFVYIYVTYFYKLIICILNYEIQNANIKMKL